MDLVSKKVYDILSTKNTFISPEKPYIGVVLDESGWKKAGKKVLVLLGNTLGK